jgi:ferredoxin
MCGYSAGERGEAAMQVDVHWDECEANGVCTEAAPDIFELDDNDELHLLVTVVPADREAAAREAVEGCPKRALYLREEA